MSPLVLVSLVWIIMYQKFIKKHYEKNTATNHELTAYLAHKAAIFKVEENITCIR